MKTELLIDVTKIITEHCGEKLATGLLVDLINTFLSNGLTAEDLEDCYGADDLLDQVLDDFELPESSEDDDWPDGGREHF